MRKHILGLMAGGLLMSVAGVAAAQDVAVATTAPIAKPNGNLVVFTENGDHVLSSTALTTIRAAADKARDGRIVTLSGNPRSIGLLRDELVRHGVSASSIVAHNDGGRICPSRVTA